MHVRARFWLEAILAALATGLLLLTLIRRDWIELAFGVEPDASSGALEWLIVGGLLVATVLLIAAARAEWQRPRMLHS